MSESAHEQKVGLIDQNRVFNFSDGVFAFAATLLVVKIDLPPIIKGDFDHNLVSAFSLLWPQYLVNIISFVVIGFYWINHHAILGHIKHFNSVLVWLNIFFLLSIAFLPFPVDLYGDFPTSQVAVLFYTASLAISGFLLLAIWLYASNDHKLISKNMSKNEINYYTMRNLVAPVVFTVSMPLVYLHPLFTPASWILVLVGIMIVNKKFHVHEYNIETP